MKSLAKKLLPRAVTNWVRHYTYPRMLTSGQTVQSGLGQVDGMWRARIDDVLASPDNDHIPRVPDAGKIEDYYITMHNGVKVCAHGYYGFGNMNMLIENKGVHEPQEERVFEAITDLLPEECSMLELGAYWGFYSLSLLRKRPRAKVYLVEPDIFRLLSGKTNFKLNGRRGDFTEALVDAAPGRKGPTVSVDSFCAKKRIHELDILHADIQGFESAMLDGARETLSSGRVKYVFVSTHSNELHRECIEKLEAYGYPILAEADLQDTFSFDGLIVAKRRDIAEPAEFTISRKSQLQRGSNLS